MTDQQTLLHYRLQQAEETLSDAEKMLHNNVNARSIVNRAYYAMFYAILALFIKYNISLKTSKHAGIITLFDKEFIHTGKLDKRYSKTLHKSFDLRQECDYKEFAEISKNDATQSIQLAKEFCTAVKKLIES